MINISQYVNSSSDGCVLCLETERGCLTDTSNRPIVLSIGMVYGTLDDMKNQVEYALSRAQTHNVSNGICTVIECNHKSFRFPERHIKEIFDIARFKYKECTNGPIHFIYLPSLYRIGFKFALNFVPSSLRENIIVHKDLKTFLENIPLEYQLKRWKGTLDFDIDQYTKWRCDQENTEVTIIPEKISQKCVQESLYELQQSSNSKVLLPVADGVFYMEKYDFLGKQKKKKMLMIVQNHLFIFDSTKITNTNTFSRKTSLNSATVYVKDSKLHVETNLRTFIFYCDFLNEYERFQSVNSSRC